MMAIEAAGLRKSFGKVQALRGVDLAVPQGSVCALLGPNGAGKTTAVRVLATLIRPDGGSALVAGHDVVREPGKVRGAIGLAGQHAAVDDDLTGRENLLILGLMQRLGRRRAKARAAELLERFGLADAGGRLVKTWSGGMQRRLDLIASLIVTPSGPVPRRAHHRPRPAQPVPDLVGRPVAGGGGHHGAAEHAVPGGGRPPRRPDRDHRRRPGDRAGDSR